MTTYKFKCPHCGSEIFDCVMPVPTLFKTCERVRMDAVGEPFMMRRDYDEADGGAVDDTPRGKICNIECYSINGCRAKWNTFKAALEAGAFTVEGGEA